jgi:hypothetical protein
VAFAQSGNNEFILKSIIFLYVLRVCEIERGSRGGRRERERDILFWEERECPYGHTFVWP